MPTSAVPAWLVEVPAGVTATAASVMGDPQQPHEADLFWSTVADDLHEGLFAGDFDRVRAILQPQPAPAAPPPRSPNPAEVLWHLAELGRLAAEGWPFWSRPTDDDDIV
jgi:hypothetical protein